MIYHIIDVKSWNQALEKGFYKPASLAKEGFIHASSLAQVAGVRNRYYKGVDNLLLLHIHEEKVDVPIKNELSPTVNETFPHIYGPLPVVAVVHVEELKKL
ncbi:MAG: DUF952 domain-containing protein [Ferruginibacter sp.]